MDRGKSLIADTKTMEKLEPSVSMFDDPLIHFNFAAMSSAALGDYKFGTPITQFLPVCFGHTPGICIDDLRLLEKATASDAGGWNSLSEQQQSDDVIAIDAALDDRQRYPVCAGRGTVLRAPYSTVYGIRLGFWPVLITRTEDQSTTTHDRSIFPVARNRQLAVRSVNPIRLLLASRVRGTTTGHPGLHPIFQVRCVDAALCATQTHTQRQSMLRDWVSGCNLDSPRVERSVGAATERFIAINRRLTGMFIPDFVAIDNENTMSTKSTVPTRLFETAFNTGENLRAV